VSLDIYLEMPAEVGELRERIYVRRDGRTEEITREEWDELYPGREPTTVTLPDDAGEVFWQNITHNLGKMAGECGLYEPMWRPDAHGWTRARDLIEPLKNGLAELQSNPEHYKQFDPPNGWGDYQLLLEVAALYLAACMKWPDATVRVWR
jgi:hypothetical protein